MDFIDMYAGSFDEEKVKRAEELEIKIAPGHFSLLLSNDHREIRKKRREYDLIAGVARTRQEMNKMLTDTYYDFFIVFPELKLSKRVVRMAKRYETPIAVPLAPVFSLKQRILRNTIRNLLVVQDNNGMLLLCSGAESAEQIRSGRDLASIGVLLGLKPDYARKAVKHFPNFVLERSKKRRKQAAWGVEVLEDG